MFANDVALLFTVVLVLTQRYASLDVVAAIVGRHRSSVSNLTNAMSPHTWVMVIAAVGRCVVQIM